jgi:inorganic pyrophosphatase
MKTPWSRLPAMPAPGVLNLVVESPAGSRNKYKYDQKLGLFRLNRVLPFEATFPFDYGFAPGTRSGDGDPLDVVLVGEAPTFAGCVVRGRPIGVLRATKEGVQNDRLIAVALLSKAYAQVHDLSELPPGVLVRIERFFRTVLDETGGEHQIGAFEDAAHARRLLKWVVQGDVKVVVKAKLPGRKAKETKQTKQTKQTKAAGKSKQAPAKGAEAPPKQRKREA